LVNIEDKIISQAHITIWADIARELQRRSDNAVKNHWNASIKRRIRKFLAHKQQLDPANLPLTEDARFDFHPDEFESVLHVAGSGKDTEFDKLQNRVLLSTASVSIPSINISSDSTYIDLKTYSYVVIFFQKNIHK